MKKLIALLAAGLLTGSVYAADFKITGDAFVRGTATRNLADTNKPGSDAAKNYYDMEFHIFPVIQVDKNTKIVMKLTADFDQVLDKSKSTTWAKDYAAGGQGVSDGPTLTVETCMYPIFLNPQAQRYWLVFSQVVHGVHRLVTQSMTCSV